MGCNSGRRGLPFGVASPHCHFTVGTEWERIIPGVSTNVMDEDEIRVLAVNSDFVLYDFPPSDGNVRLLHLERCLK